MQQCFFVLYIFGGKGLHFWPFLSSFHCYPFAATCHPAGRTADSFEMAGILWHGCEGHRESNCWLLGLDKAVAAVAAVALLFQSDVAIFCRKIGVDVEAGRSMLFASSLFLRPIGCRWGTLAQRRDGGLPLSLSYIHSDKRKYDSNIKFFILCLEDCLFLFLCSLVFSSADSGSCVLTFTVVKEETLALV